MPIRRRSSVMTWQRGVNLSCICPLNVYLFDFSGEVFEFKLVARFSCYGSYEYPVLFVIENVLDESVHNLLSIAVSNFLYLCRYLKRVVCHEKWKRWEHRYYFIKIILQEPISRNRKVVLYGNFRSSSWSFHLPISKIERKKRGKTKCVEWNSCYRLI